MAGVEACAFCYATCDSTPWTCVGASSTFPSEDVAHCGLIRFKIVQNKIKIFQSSVFLWEVHMIWSILIHEIHTYMLPRLRVSLFFASHVQQKVVHKRGEIHADFSRKWVFSSEPTKIIVGLPPTYQNFCRIASNLQFFCRWEANIRPFGLLWQERNLGSPLDGSTNWRYIPTYENSSLFWATLMELKN